MEEFKPAPTLLISDLETLRVMTDSLRNQVIETLVFAPLTVKQVAERLGLAPGKLYYHINLLEKHNLIRVVETRIVSGIIEKTYRAVAAAFDIDPALLNYASDTGPTTLYGVISSTLETTRDDMIRSLQSRMVELEQGAPKRPRQFMCNRTISRVPVEKAEEFQQRMRDLIEEFSAIDEGPDCPDIFAITIAFYPTIYFPTDPAAAQTDLSDAAPLDGDAP